MFMLESDKNFQLPGKCSTSAKENCVTALQVSLKLLLCTRTTYAISAKCIILKISNKTCKT
jgi:hypothetical protein